MKRHPEGTRLKTKGGARTGHNPKEEGIREWAGDVSVEYLRDSVLYAKD